ncbi:DUF2934 domain-containing protein [Methylobacterium sp. SI9]|uniref:DUF2934 domain-containing protein n=1 Tax=Methylobacterium guangdongense TaxID=3138811 RepID=UPI00313B8D57
MNHDSCIASAVEPTISHAQIRERAYDLWDRHHRPDGYDLHFWVMAERELKAERMATLDARLATEEGIPDPGGPDLPTPGEPPPSEPGPGDPPATQLPTDPVPGDPIGPDISPGDPTGPGTVM